MPLPQRQDQQHPKRRNTHAPDKRLRLRELRGKKSMPKNSRPGQKGIFKSVAKDRMMTYVVSYREAQTPARDDSSVRIQRQKTFDREVDAIEFKRQLHNQFKDGTYTPPINLTRRTERLHCFRRWDETDNSRTSRKWLKRFKPLNATT